jgi:antirestriction protein ArdC
MKDQKLNIYDEITQKIISAIEDGVAPWRKSWNSVNLGPFRNAVTNRPYRGINTLLLSLSAFSKGFFDPRWLTFNKASELGGRVRKGERGTTIVFWKFLERKENVDEIQNAGNREEDLKVIPLARRYTVFNVEQCDGLNFPELTPLENTDPENGNEIAEQILTVATIRHGGDTACYFPGADMIFLPRAADFESMDHYYSTAFHEIVHYTKHPTRLNRDFRLRFKTEQEARAMEELVAEIGAAFLESHARVPFEGMQHPEYIHSWLEVLKGDNRAIFTAAAKAQAAADYVLEQAGISTEAEEEMLEAINT